MNLQFTQTDVAMAQSFADKAKLWQSGPVTIASVEGDNDTLQVGAFAITQVEDTRVTKSILGERIEPAIAFVVTAGLQRYCRDTGDEVDIVDIAREWTLRKALQACAHAELDWALDSMEY